MSGLRSSVVPDLIAALVERLDTVLPDVTVTTGLGNGLSSGERLAVGVIDPDARTPATGATSSITWSTSIAQDNFDETGDVALAAICISGDDDMAEAIAKVYAILAGVIAHIRDSWVDQDLLGVQGLWDLHVTSTELTPAITDTGAIAYLLFRLAFQATI